jgi:hypothetical protein
MTIDCGMSADADDNGKLDFTDAVQSLWLLRNTVHQRAYAPLYAIVVASLLAAVRSASGRRKGFWNGP